MENSGFIKPIVGRILLNDFKPHKLSIELLMLSCNRF